MQYLLFVLLGFFVGVILCLVFFQMDNQWKSLISVSSSGGFIALFPFITTLLNISGQVPLFITYIASIMFAAVVSFYVLSSRLKNQEDTKYKLRSMDIILGRKNTIDEYYANRQKDIDRELNIDKLEQKSAELEYKEKKIIEKEKAIEEQLECAKQVVATGTFIELPLNNNIPIDNSFLNTLPEFTYNLMRFTQEINKLTEQFLEKSSSKEDFKFLHGYLFAICTYTSIYLFDSNSNVRTHFRFLNKDDQYVKLASSLGKTPLSEPLTPILSDKGMIFQAGKIKRSIIKSLNLEYHVKATNDHIWEDYMTVVFDKFYYNGKPLISMGISVKNKEHYKRNMYFLNHCKIESIIQDTLLKFNDKCNILGCVQKFEGGI